MFRRDACFDIPDIKFYLSENLSVNDTALIFGYNACEIGFYTHDPTENIYLGGKSDTLTEECH